MSSSSSSPPPTSTPLSSTSTTSTRISPFKTPCSVERTSVSGDLRCENAFYPSETEHHDGPLRLDPTDPSQISTFGPRFSVEGKSVPDNPRCKNKFCSMKTLAHLGGPLCFDSTDPSQISYPPPPLSYLTRYSKRAYLSHKKTLTKAEEEAQKMASYWIRNFVYVHGILARQKEKDEERANNKKNFEEQKAPAPIEKVVRNPKHRPGAEKLESITKQLLPPPRRRPLNNEVQQPSFCCVKPAHHGDDSRPPAPSDIKEVRHFTHPIFQRRNSSPPDGPEPRGSSMNFHGSVPQTAVDQRKILAAAQASKTGQTQKNNNNKALNPKAPEFHGSRRERNRHVITGHASSMAKSKSI
ncbi:MAG: hypothetical protein LQ342_006180 [Letrouitia transgressa]|nr:MAG: hypothetical protein LQ342_006180 [Letrouitia transgressa]